MKMGVWMHAESSLGVGHTVVDAQEQIVELEDGCDLGALVELHYWAHHRF